MVTPPPVPMRTPPAVPKRKFTAQNNPSTQAERIMKFTQQSYQHPSKQLQRRASLNSESRTDDEWFDKSHMQTANQQAAPYIGTYPTILAPVALRRQIARSPSIPKTDTFAFLNGAVPIKSHEIQYNGKQLPVASTVAVNLPTERIVDPFAYPNILYNPTSSLQRKFKSSEVTFNGPSIINRRKILPPIPNEVPPVVPPRKVASNNTSKTSTDVVRSTVAENDNKPANNPQVSKPEKPPPLMHVNTTNNIQKSPSSNKVSIRQDSSISSDSFSQTSSPSYTTKAMETPLLPHANRYCNGKLGGNKQNSLIMKNNAEAFDIEKDSKNNSAALTKSISTPASLQTIVRFHNGSNMSLHHRVSMTREVFSCAEILHNQILTSLYSLIHINNSMISFTYIFLLN